MRRAERPVRVVAIGGSLVLALLLIGLSLTASVARRVNTNDAVEPGTTLLVPLLSARRTPTVLSAITRIGRLTSSLSVLNKQLPPNTCLAVSWMGRSVTSSHVDNKYTPASVMKLFTAFAALQTLGPTHTFTTSIKGEIKDGVVTGDLYFVGGGDPLLVRRDYVANEKYPTLTPSYMEILADAVVAAGVRSITGTIVGVDNRYDDVRYPSTWSSAFYGSEGGPLGALMSSDGSALGQVLKPDDPAIGAADDLHSLLGLRGVVLSGQSIRGKVADSVPTIAELTSAPLTDIVREMLVNSDNNTAELLLKEMGYVVKKSGTTADGLAVVLEQLNKASIPMTGVEIFDGSGLTRQNTATCQALMAVLTQESATLPTMLAVAGETGTLAPVFGGQSIKGRLVAKTGTLRNVKSIAGYIPLKGADPVIFSLIINKVGIENQSQYRPLWYALGDALGRASVDPRPEDLAP
ncbi:MAG: D-alanyl-D-alanine carboxypeptidase/D-alanyl-D-alanine-endopeptidase [Ilumatobacteraceae bacterium]|nr:D-alanyl-D-alanine carboxypeptidase/D-alanyl-D-alanine-endopeptidase [Ilumatobacteraceae bacterium]